MAKSDNGELSNSSLASNNSDPNNSLLQKVTKRVSGLFPSSISKWFGPSDGNISVVRRREMEDDDEQLQIQQPPKKRAKSASAASTSTSSADAMVEFSTTSNHFQMTSTPMINSRHLQPGPSGYTRHTSILYDAGDGPSTTALNGSDDKSDKSDKSEKSDSGESTSGYSSVRVQQNKDQQQQQQHQQPSTSKNTGTSSSPNKSQNTSLNSRSLFSDQSLTTNPQRQCLSARRPSFNSSTFGSPTFMDRTLSTKRAVNSPFYGGRTIYGGASAYKRNRIVFPRDDANQIQIKNSVNIKPVNDEAATSNENVSLSKTARRILDTLEHFSTPVTDAKKIPNINRQQKVLSQRHGPYARATETNQKPTALNRELIIPTVPDLLKMKQKERLQTSTEQVRKLATTSKSVLNSEYSIRTLDDVNETVRAQKHTTKIRAKFSGTTSRDKNDGLLRDTIDAVQLPDVKLPITSLPKFDFTLTPPPPPPTTPTTTTLLKPLVLPTVIKEKTPEINLKTGYTFAKPTEIVVVNCDKLSTKSINHFKFREPIDAKRNIPHSHPQTPSSSSSLVSLTFKAGCSTAPRKKEQKNNGQNNVEFTLKPPEKLVDGSVMDVLGKPDKSDNTMDKFKPVVGTWECLTCMVRNIPTATRCVACETLKEPVKKPEEPNKKPAFGNQYKISAEKWECSACLVRNNNAELKCVACTTPKPNSTTVPPTTTPNTKPSIFGGFGDKFKPATDTWECGACMIRNKNDAVKCVACETPKTGVPTTSTVGNTKPSLIMKLPEAPTSSGFTELIKKQQTNWECPSCMVRNPPEKKNCACCEGPKPGEKQEFKFGATGATQFKFGVDKSAAANNSGSGGFNFGANPVVTTFSFGVKPASSNTVDTKPTGFTFGIPPTTTETTTPKNTESQVASIVTTAVATTTPSFSFGIPIQTTSSNVVQINGDAKKMFSFGTQSTTITSSTNSNTKPTTTSIFNAATVTATTTTPSVSNSTVSSTSTPSTTTASAAATTFSFGAIPKQTTTIDEAKKTSNSTPQFNFGSGNLSFNPVFGSGSTIPPKTTASAFAQPPTTNFSITTSQTQNLNQTGFNPNASTFTFKSSSAPAAATTTPTTNNNKTEVKPFSFATTPKTETTPRGGASGGGKFPEFTFNPLTTNAPTATATAAATTVVPLSKGPVMNFASDAAASPAAATNAQKTSNSLFSFGAKTDAKPSQPLQPSFGGGGGGSMFGQQQQGVQQTPQNGGFNFGATAVTPNFNFGAGAGGGAGSVGGAGAATASSTTGTVFGFGTGQAGSGSATAASAPGLFTFGGGAPAQQPTIAAFTPDIKPNFNFSGGTSIASFTAQGGPSATMPQRKIRKAVRRTQPR